MTMISVVLSKNFDKARFEELLKEHNTNKNALLNLFLARVVNGDIDLKTFLLTNEIQHNDIIDEIDTLKLYIDNIIVRLVSLEKEVLHSNYLLEHNSNSKKETMNYIEVPDIYIDEQNEKSYFLHKETGTPYEIKLSNAYTRLKITSCIPSIYDSVIKKDTLKVTFEENKLILNKLYIEYEGFYSDNTEFTKNQSYYLYTLHKEFTLSETWQNLTTLKFKCV